MSIDEKRRLIEGDNKELSIRRQCELVGLPRSNWYYEPAAVSDETLRLMHRVDEIFTEYPFYGSRRIREALRREGFGVGRERVQACMRQMGLRAIYPKGNMSKRHPGHKIYPYLLSDIEITYPNQVWASDITYPRLLLAGAGICVPCGDNRLVQSLCVVVAYKQYDGCFFL